MFDEEELSAPEFFNRSEDVVNFFNWDKVPLASEVNTHGLNFQAPFIRLRELPNEIQQNKEVTTENETRISLLYEPKPIVSVQDNVLDKEPQDPPFTREYMRAVAEQLIRLGFRAPQGGNWVATGVDKWNGGLLPTKDPRVFVDIVAINLEGESPVTNISLVVKPKIEKPAT